MTFGAPLFLIGLLAGVIPVLLHMINRHQAKQLPFSTLRFLRLSTERTRRRKYLHDLLLLLLRVAALALIAVGLARPTVQRLGNFLGGNSRTAVVVVLDNSMSMGTVDDRQSRWQRATNTVERLLDQLGDDDAAALLATCGPSHSATARLYENHANIRQNLDDLRVSHGTADLATGLKQARVLLDASDADNKEIYVITDMQANAWSGLATSPTITNETATDVPVIAVDVRRQAGPNVALRRVELTTAAPVAGVPIQLTVELQGDADLSQQRRVALFLDGQKQEISPNITIEAGRRTSHSLQCAVNTPGIHRGELRLVGEDACAMDDRLFFVLDLKRRIPVAVVKPEDHPIKYLEPTFYLEKALQPSGTEEWPIGVNTLTAKALSSDLLENYAVIFCVNLPALDQTLANRLRQYVGAGGHLVWVCGDNVDPDRYSSMDEAASNELLPARLIGTQETSEARPDGWRIGWLDEKHPALQAIATPTSLYQSVIVKKYMLVEDALDDSQVLARLDDGQPLLAHRSIGSGSVSFLATAVYVDWTNLPLRPVFLPLVTHWTLHLADARRTAHAELIAGTPLDVSLAREDANAQLQFTDPSGNVRRIREKDQSVVRFGDTYETGVYEVEVLNSRRADRSAFAFNHDPNETDPEVLSRDVLRERFGEQPFALCEDPDQLDATVKKFREGSSMLEYFLAGVLIALVAETFVANRMVKPADNISVETSADRLRRVRERLSALES